jgi:hypothetical protein
VFGGNEDWDEYNNKWIDLRMLYLNASGWLAGVDTSAIHSTISEFRQHECSRVNLLRENDMRRNTHRN